MSVLQFSRKSEVIAEEPVVTEVEKPVPIKIRSVEILKTSRIPRFFRNCLIAFLAAVLLLAYPLLVLHANKISDELSFPESINQNWSSPWAGVGTKLLEREVATHEWISDAPAWSPQARLTAMPAYQMAIIHAVGDFSELVNLQLGNGLESDLNSVALLLSRDVSADQIRAASEALTSYDGGVRLRRYDDTLTAQRYAQRLELMLSWLRQSSFELANIANNAQGLPFDKRATEAVYRAKARAYVAHRFLSYMNAPVGLSIKNEHSDSLNTLARAAKFRPFIVLNGKADGMFFASHPAALYQQLKNAEAEILKTFYAVEDQL